MMRLIWQCTAWIALALTAAAAEEVKPERARRQVRFLAVGDAPPFLQEVRDGVRRELPPPPGAVPPGEISISTADGDEALDAEAPPLAVRLQLGRVTEALAVPAGAGVLSVRQSMAAAEPWFKLARPEEGDFLVIIWRDPRGKNWDQVRAMTLTDRRPPGTVTFLNVASANVGIVLGPEKIALLPAKPMLRALPPGIPAEFQLGLPTADGTFRRVVAMSLEQQQGEHTLLVISRSDGAGARLPLKLTSLRSRRAP